jgi:hypothetical protein
MYEQVCASSNGSRNMKWSFRLLFGPLAAAILFIGIVALAMRVPGYSHIRQTVSEIGPMGSPARVPFAVMLCAVSFCLRGGALWAVEKPFYGLVQRSLFVTWFGWCAGIGILLYSRPVSLRRCF